jgi:hypothetical protein
VVSSRTIWYSRGASPSDTGFAPLIFSAILSLNQYEIPLITRAIARKPVAPPTPPIA